MRTPNFFRQLLTHELCEKPHNWLHVSPSIESVDAFSSFSNLGCSATQGYWRWGLESGGRLPHSSTVLDIFLSDKLGGSKVCCPRQSLARFREHSKRGAQ